MASFKIVVADGKTRKTQTVELKDQQAQPLLGLRLGEEVDGSLLGVQGRVRITGGSDRAGFPMRSDISGGVKKYVLLTEGVGFRKGSGNGQKKRKLVRGNTITDEIYQLNCVLV
ncbi:MAG TPA: S6e family ribosomal protein [Nitrososphaerales archaeon]|nr:S6e family ribosomal protein [Nitrososphaerales archaeon]